MCFRCGQAQDECCPFAQYALTTDAAAHGLSEFFDDRETQARGRFAASWLRAKADEFAKEPFLVGFADARPLVLDGNPGETFFD